MILVDVHQRDVFEEIVKRKIKDPEDFEWQKQAHSRGRRPPSPPHVPPYAA